MTLEITAMGDTEKERNSYAWGVRMGFCYAAELLKQRAAADKEKAGSNPSGPYTEAANYVEARTPKGSVEAHFKVK